MNKERLLKLASHIEKLEHITNVVYSNYNCDDLMELEGFNMTFFLSKEAYNCKSAGCIAGQAACFFKDIPTTYKFSIEARAQEILDLSTFESHQLFYPPGDAKKGYADFTPQDGALAIRRLVEGINPLEIWNESPCLKSVTEEVDE